MLASHTNEETADVSLQNSGPETQAEMQELLPLNSMSLSERARLRVERDRILDQLEEEERITQLREKERQSRHEDGHKVETEEERKAIKPKKNVSFAGLPPGEQEDQRTENTIKDLQAQSLSDAGSVVPGRLWSSNDRDTLMKRAARIAAQPMKMEVVERLPAHAPKTNESVAEVASDSDDASSFGDDASLSQEPHDYSDIEHRDDGVLDDEYDLDTAQHQREVTLEYLKKHATVGQEIFETMSSHNETEDPWSQPEVPLDATLSSAPPKPLVSKFKASRMAAGAAGPVHGPAVAPVLASNTLQRAIRTGKVVNGQLVGPDDSDEEQEGVSQFMDALKRGEVQNVGPEFAGAGIVDGTTSGTSPTRSRVQVPRVT